MAKNWIAKRKKNKKTTTTTPQSNTNEEDEEDDDVFKYDELKSTLECLGYMDYVSKEILVSAKKAMFPHHWPFWDDRSGRRVYFDEEVLIKKGGGKFISNLSHFLKLLGVEINSIEEHLDDDYRLIVNGKEILVWSKEEQEAEKAGEPVEVWGVTMVRIFGLINEMLEQVGSEERLYAVSGFDGLAAYFLTAQMADFMHESMEVEIADRPYIPVMEYPDYGQPDQNDTIAFEPPPGFSSPFTSLEEKLKMYDEEMQRIEKEFDLRDLKNRPKKK